MSAGRNRSLLAFFAIMATAAIVYSNSLPNAYTFDDHPIVESNPVIQSGSWSDVLTSPFWPGQPELGLYRPVTLVSFALNYRMIGPGPSGFHLINILLHGLACWLLFLVVDGLCGYRPGLVAALVFATHPVHSEAVNAIVGRADLLAGLFFLLAWYAHRRSTESWPWRILSAVAYGLACFSKEHAIVLPAVLVAEDILLTRDGTIAERCRSLLRVWGRYGPLAAVGVGILAIRYVVIGHLTLPHLPDFVDNPFAHADGVDRVLSGFSVLARYLGLAFLPVDLSVDYTFAQLPVSSSFLDVHLIAGFVTFAAILTIAYRAAKDEVNALVALGPIVFLLAWFPISNIPFAIGTPMNERLLYLPMIGFGVFAGVGYGRLEESARGYPPWIVAMVLCLLFAVRTTVRNADWRDDLTLFTAATEVSPNSAKAFFNLGNALRDVGNDTGALDAYVRALAIHPEYAEVHYNRGVVYQREQKPDLALVAYEHAIGSDPDHVSALVNRGILLSRAGRQEAAVETLERAAEIAPDRADIHYNLALALERVDGREGVTAYRKALGIRPGYEDAAVNLALVLRKSGQPQEALEVYRSVLAANPGANRAAYNLAAELDRAGEVGEAVDVYRRVWAAGDEAGAFSRFRMGALFAASGKIDSARTALEEFKKVWKGDSKVFRSAERLLDQMKGR